MNYNFKINPICKKTHNKTWNNNDQPYDIILINKFKELIDKKESNNLNILDIGAQTGSFTLLAKMYKNTKWYAFEPVEESYNLLISNLELNNINNVKTFKNALSDKNIEMNIKIPNNKHLGIPTLGKNPPHIDSYYEVPVNCLKGDDIFYNKIKIDIIKLDAEGAEIDIINGLKQSILLYKPTILLEVALGCLAGFNYNLNDLLNIIHDINYKISWYDRESWKGGGNIIITPI